MKSKIILATISTFVAITFIFIYQNPSQKDSIKENFPLPTNGETEVREGQMEGEGSDAREQWIELSHRTAPEIDWKKMDRKFRNKIFQKRNGQSLSLRTMETLANGNLTGEWIELGSNNQAGNLTTVEFEKATDKIYGISGGGVLWSGNLNGTGWTVLDEKTGFRNGILQVVEDASSNKIILTAIGKDIHYSTDNGLTWTASVMNVNSIDNWGEPTEMVALDDGTIYYMRRAWDSGPWAARMWVYRSTDYGENFTHIATFDPVGSATVNSAHTQMWLPLAGSTVFVLHQGKELYTIDGTTVKLRNSNATLTEEVRLDLEGNITGTDTTLYAFLEKKDLYKSTDLGATWTFEGATPKNSWNVGIGVSQFDKNKLYMGEVEPYRSDDGGQNWSRVTRWWRYYSNPDSIHADIMDIQSFETSTNAEIVLVANHGGLHVSYDDLQTTTNISLDGLNIGQYYDVRTDPLDDNFVYVGTQDQGYQRTSVASGATGPVDFTQVISGDYGHLAFSRNNQSLWMLYPFGNVSYYHNPQTNGQNSSYDLNGNHTPVSNWIFPTSETLNPANNSIYIAGGEITGGNGSHLVTLTALTSSPYTISATQFSYDFRANSNTTTSAISAIEASNADADRIYVATDDGTFFYTNDGGTTWNKAASFTGPGEYYLYGATIFASQTTSNLVYFGGSGYSIDPVWKSTDGGVTFTTMSNGLPSSLVHEIVANDTETMLFAATDVGPYVYVVADDMWYPMLGATAPIQRYYSVEFVDGPDSIVRFGTYGRGIWDFKISTAPLPVELMAFEAKIVDNQQVRLSWTTASEIGNDFFEIERSADGINFENIAQVPSQGNGTNRNDYQILDEKPHTGKNYYRLKQVDYDGKFEYSEIRQVEIKEVITSISVFPNPVRKGESVFIKNATENMSLEIFDSNGKLIQSKILQKDNSISTDNLQTGTYFYRIKNSKNGVIAPTGKLLIL